MSGEIEALARQLATLLTEEVVEDAYEESMSMLRDSLADEYRDRPGEPVEEVVESRLREISPGVRMRLMDLVTSEMPEVIRTEFLEELGAIVRAERAGDLETAALIEALSDPLEHHVHEWAGIMADDIVAEQVDRVLEAGAR